jgi:hypothetical protein
MRLPEDTSGYAIPAADLLADQLIECELLDVESGDPAEWLSWADADYWQLGPEPYEPTAADQAGEAARSIEIDARDDEEEHARRIADFLDWRAAQNRVSDEDVRAAGQAVG